MSQDQADDIIPMPKRRAHGRDQRHDNDIIPMSFSETQPAKLSRWSCSRESCGRLDICEDTFARSFGREDQVLTQDGIVKLAAPHAALGTSQQRNQNLGTLLSGALSTVTATPQDNSKQQVKLQNAFAEAPLPPGQPQSDHSEAVMLQAERAANCTNVCDYYDKDDMEPVKTVSRGVTEDFEEGERFLQIPTDATSKANGLGNNALFPTGPLTSGNTRLDGDNFEKRPFGPAFPNTLRPLRNNDNEHTVNEYMGASGRMHSDDMVGSRLKDSTEAESMKDSTLIIREDLARDLSEALPQPTPATQPPPAPLEEKLDERSSPVTHEIIRELSETPIQPLPITGPRATLEEKLHEQSSPPTGEMTGKSAESAAQSLSMAHPPLAIPEDQSGETSCPVAQETTSELSESPIKSSSLPLTAGSGGRSQPFPYIKPLALPLAADPNERPKQSPSIEQVPPPLAADPVGGQQAPQNMELVSLPLVADTSGEHKNTRQVTFQPGKIGLVADWTTGQVLAVRNDSQAHKGGVNPGWEFKTINGKPYSEAILNDVMAGTVPYHVVFKIEAEVGGAAREEFLLEASGREALANLKPAMLPRCFSGVSEARENGAPPRGLHHVPMTPTSVHSQGEFPYVPPLPDDGDREKPLGEGGLNGQIMDTNLPADDQTVAPKLASVPSSVAVRFDMSEWRQSSKTQAVGDDVGLAPERTQTQTEPPPRPSLRTSKSAEEVQQRSNLDMKVRFEPQPDEDVTTGNWKPRGKDEVMWHLLPKDTAARPKPKPRRKQRPKSEEREQRKATPYPRT